MSITVRFDPTANSQQAQIIGDATINSDGVMTAAQVQQLNDPAALIPDASLTERGLMTPEQVQQLNQALTTTKVALFMNPTGNDSNDGLTPATAWQTLEKLIANIPNGTRKGYAVDFADGTYPLDCTGNRTVNFGFEIGIGSASPDAPTIDWIGKANNILASGTATVGSNGDFIEDNNFVGGADAFVGEMIRCTSAANAANVGFVTNVGIETAGPGGPGSGRFSVQVPFPDLVSVGDTFEIFRPSVIIAPFGGACVLSGSTVRMNSIQFDCDGTIPGFIPSLVFPGNAIVLFQKSLINGNGTNVFIENTAQVGATWVPLGPNDTFSDFSTRAGLFFTSGGVNIFAGGHLRGDVAIAFAGTTIQNGYFEPQSLTSYVNQFGVYQSTAIIACANTNGLVTVPGRIRESYADGINSAQSTLYVDGIDVSSTGAFGGADGINISQACNLTIALFNPCGGTGNPGAGIRVNLMSNSTFGGGNYGLPGSGVTINQGDPTEVVVGVTPQTYAAILGAGGFTDATNNRVQPV